MSDYSLKIKCPYCNEIQAEHARIQSWKYGWGKVKVTRFECKCGTDFNFYDSSTSNKKWTIPKPKSEQSG